MVDISVCTCIACRLPNTGLRCHFCLVYNTYGSTQMCTELCREQINLGASHRIISITTLGHPSREFWVTSYTLSYGQDGSTWTDVADSSALSTNSVLSTSLAPTVFTANVDRDTPQENTLAQPIETQFLILHPVSTNLVALRWGVFGCATGKVSNNKRLA